MVALQYRMSAILTKSKIKDNYFRNLFQSALFPETKLAAELTNMLKILKVIKYFLETLFHGHGELKIFEANLTKLQNWPF